MESILSTILSTENVRTLAILVSIFSCTMWNRVSVKKLEHKMELSIKELEYKIKGLEHKTELSIKELEYKIKGLDYKIEALTARFEGVFEALTYVLEKNGSISKEDKGYVDSRLALSV